MALWKTPRMSQELRSSPGASWAHKSQHPRDSVCSPDRGAVTVPGSRGTEKPNQALCAWHPANPHPGLWLVVGALGAKVSPTQRWGPETPGMWFHSRIHYRGRQMTGQTDRWRDRS